MVNLCNSSPLGNEDYDSMVSRGEIKVDDYKNCHWLIGSGPKGSTRAHPASNIYVCEIPAGKWGRGVSPT